jgi:adenylate cyclase
MARQYREQITDDPLRHDTTIRLCERALAIYPGYALAWTVMGAAQMSLFYLFGRKNDAGATAIAQALQLDPNLGEAHALRARELHRAGLRDEALAELATALKLDPDSYDVNYRAGQIYYLERRFADAVPSFRKLTQMRDSEIEAPGMLVSCLNALGDHAAARVAARTTLERAETALTIDHSNGEAMAHGVSALAALGQRQRAREWVDRALLLEPDNVNMCYNFACTLSLYLKDVEGALGLLEAVFVRDRIDLVAAASTDPDLDPIRDDPRFAALLSQARARIEASGSGPPS